MVAVSDHMRILSLTAGAASMYCGSCLRDNALAAELIRQGHDVTLLPFYTPTLTDEENVSRQQKVFFGGISVYLEQHIPWYRRGRLIDKIVDAPRVIRAFTSGSIAVDPKQLGAMTVSTLRGVNGHQRKEIDKLIEFVTADAPPDVINIPYTLLIGLAAPFSDSREDPFADCWSRIDVLRQLSARQRPGGGINPAGSRRHAAALLHANTH